MMGPYDRVSQGKRDYMYGVVTSKGDHKKPVAQAFRKYRLNCSPLFQTAWYGYTGNVVADYSYPGGPAGVPSDLAYITNTSAVFPYEAARLRERCMEKIYGKLRGESQILIDLAESGETIRMVKNALRFRSTAIGFVKQMLAGRKKSASELSSKWLEYRYGWMPLMSSMYDAADTLRRKIETDIITVSGRASTQKYDSRSYSFTNNLTDKNWFEYCRASQRMHIGLRFRPPDKHIQQILNWTSINPLLIAWELVPLSFVADWFVNVGDQLAAWENFIVYSNYFLGGYETRSVREDRYGYLIDGNPISPRPEYYSDGSLKQKSYGYRTTFSGSVRFSQKDRIIDIPLPRPAGLRVNINLSSKRVTDAAALTSKWWRKLL